MERTNKFTTLVAPGLLKKEAAGKRAATLRMTQMLSNSLDLQLSRIQNVKDSDIQRSLRKLSPTSSIMERYHQIVPTTSETIGGMLWVWRSIIDGSLFQEEGVWIAGRVLACNFAQLLVFGMVIFFTVFWTNTKGEILYTEKELGYIALKDAMAKNLVYYTTDVFLQDLVLFANCTQTVLGPSLPAEGIGFATVDDLWNLVQQTGPAGVGSSLLNLTDSVYGSLLGIETLLLNYTDLDSCLFQASDWEPLVNYLVDTDAAEKDFNSDELKDVAFEIDFSLQEYKVSIAGLALLSAGAVSLSTAAVLIPSYVATVQKFRSGYYPSLGDGEFLRYRNAPDSVITLIGSAFWGTFVTSLAAMVLAAGIILGLYLACQY